MRLRVVLFWDDVVLFDRVVPRGREVTVGEDPRNTLVLPDVAGIGRKHRLFTRTAGRYILNRTAEMGGWLRRGGREHTLPPSERAEVPIDFETEGLLEVGPVQVFFHFVDASLELPTPSLWQVWQRMDTNLLGSLTLAFVLQVGLLVGAYLFWDDTPNLHDLPDRSRPVIVCFDRPAPETESEAKDTPAEEPGKRAGGDEGRFGRPTETNPSRRAPREGELVARVENQALVRALSSNLMGGSLRRVFSEKTAFADRLNAAMSGTDGDLVLGRGTGGMGVRGLGSGGGGMGFGRIGSMGRLDVGGGTGTRAGLGAKPKRNAPRVGHGGPSEVLGFCRESDIQRVVKSRQAGIQYCFERELTRDPGLAGKVMLSWRIGVEGRVMKVLVESSTLGNAEVLACMSRQVERWQFPRTEGGACQIRYPFVFSSGQ